MASKSKICNICGIEKPLEQFSWRNKSKGWKHGHYKTCHSAYRRQHYLDNHRKYKHLAKKWNEENAAEIRETNRRFVFEYLLKNPCIDCGETNPLVLEFDHVRGRKRFAISVIMNGTYSLERPFEKSVGTLISRERLRHSATTAPIFVRRVRSQT